MRVLLGFLLAMLAIGLNAQAPSLLISGATLIDGTGRPPMPAVDVLIRDGVIAEIAPSPIAAPGVERVDARGKFLLPGLIDSHVHYRDWKGELLLAHGITTVYDLGNPHYYQRAIKHGFNTGRMRGPRLFFCGEVRLAEEGEEPTVRSRGLDVIRTPEEAPALVARLEAADADCLKLNERFSGDLFSALARAAGRAGLRVISHSWNVSESVRWGIGGVEHMEGIALATLTSPRAKDAVARMHLEAGHKNSALYQWMEPAEFDRVIRELVTRNVFVNPTLAFEWKALTPRRREHEQEDQGLLANPALGYVPRDDRLVILGQYRWADDRAAEEIRQFQDGYRKVQQFLARFVQAGGRIYAGTDSSAATTPGLSLHHEMQLLVDAGLTPMQAIMAATVHGAELLGLEGRLGTVEKGKMADLVVLDANPLQDIANTKKIARVIKDGRLVDTTYHADYAIPIRRPGPESKHLYNPAPVVRDILPAVAVEGAAVTLRIVGRGFTPSSVVKVDGRAVDTRWVSATELAASVAAAQPGTLAVMVETPAPGGGVSNPVEFIVMFKSDTVPDLLAEDRPYAALPAQTFDALGWDLPDGGRTVKAIADAAPGGAFDPRQLEKASPAALGYSARWHVVRYPYYGLEWDITGLQLTPNTPAPGLPTLAIIHGGSANWYEFFLDPLNRAGLAQYLAQRLPVVLITIPGNYADGGWTESNFAERIPGYVLGRRISPEEARARHAVFTFRLIAEGVRRLLEQTTTGPLLILGHSTGGELQFLLKESSLKARLADRSIGWGTGGPALITKAIDEEFGEREEEVARYGRYPRVDRLRPRDPAGYISSQYVGPLNPLAGASPLEVAQAWFAAESRRRPQFKQVLQDMEHQGMVEHRARLEQQIRDAVRGMSGVHADAAVRDLFSTMSPPLTGYRKMAWVVGRLDNGHWDARPERAREWKMAERFRKENPRAAVRVLLIDAPITHYGHIERPKPLAAVLFDVVAWLTASS